MKNISRCAKAIAKREKKRLFNGEIGLFTLFFLAILAFWIFVPSDPISDGLITLPFIALLIAWFGVATAVKIYGAVLIALFALVVILFLLTRRKVKKIKVCR